MASEAMNIGTGHAPAFRVAIVAAEHRERTKWTIELAPVHATGYESIDAMLDAVGDLPTVLLLGSGFANEQGFNHIQRLTRHHSNVGVVLLVDELSMPVLQEALRSGVRDVSLAQSDGVSLLTMIERVGDVIMDLAIQHVAPAAVIDPTTLGRVIVAFSTKGGVGKSMIATNLSTGLAMRGRKTVVVDADLQFGDVAVLLGVPPQHTTLDAAGAIQHADLDLMESLLANHPATDLRVLPAPIEPSGADSISPETMVRIVELLRQRHEFVIIDMPPHFDDVVLALLDYADDVLLIASMDIPSIKNLKVGIQTLDLLSLAGDKLSLILNRANAKVNLELADVERALGMSTDFRIPSDIAVPQAVNRGIPVILDRPKSNAGIALGVLCDHFAGTGSATSSDGNAADPASGETAKRRWRRD